MDNETAVRFILGGLNIDSEQLKLVEKIFSLDLLKDFRLEQANEGIHLNAHLAKNTGFSRFEGYIRQNLSEFKTDVGKMPALDSYVFFAYTKTKKLIRTEVYLQS